MSLNKTKYPEYLELDSTRNIGIVTIKQMERIKKVLYLIAIISALELVRGIVCTLG